MRIPPAISSGLSKLRSISPASAAAKAVGAVGIYVALRDSHHWGKIKGAENRDIANANAGLRYFANTQYLTNNSKTTSGLKKTLFRWELGNDIRGSWNYLKGYIGGFASQTFSHTLTIGGAAAAFTLKGKKSLIGLGVMALGALNTVSRHVFSHTGSKIQ